MTKNGYLNKNLLEAMDERACAIFNTVFSDRGHISWDELLMCANSAFCQEAVLLYDGHMARDGLDVENYFDDKNECYDYCAQWIIPDNPALMDLYEMIKAPAALEKTKENLEKLSKYLPRLAHEYLKHF
jgi:hypothetical protein